MFHSAEIRWFIKGEPAKPANRWIQQSGSGKAEPARTDTYLYLPGCETVGVKLRQGLFEVKAQTRGRESVQYESGLTGYREGWVKWSQKLDDLHTKGAESGDTWVSVEKRRQLRIFAVDGAEILEVPLGRHIDGAGCQVELAELTVDYPGYEGPRTWWGVCLEAFGGPDTVFDTLEYQRA